MDTRCFGAESQVHTTRGVLGSNGTRGRYAEFGPGVGTDSQDSRMQLEGGQKKAIPSRTDRGNFGVPFSHRKCIILTEVRCAERAVLLQCLWHRTVCESSRCLGHGSSLDVFNRKILSSPAPAIFLFLLGALCISQNRRSMVAAHERLGQKVLIGLWSIWGSGRILNLNHKRQGSC